MTPERIERTCTQLLACALVASTAPAGNVLVVNTAGGGPYTHIQAAVDAASDGDTILVKSGTFADVLVDNKAIVIVGDTGAVVSVIRGIQARNLAADKTLILENITSTGATSTGTLASSGLVLTDMAGRVRVERCMLTGGEGPYAYPSCTGVRADSCADASLVACDLFGGYYSAIPGTTSVVGNGAAGLGLQASNVTLYDTNARGRNGANSGGCDFWGACGNGGSGCIAFDSTLFSSGSAFKGDKGGDLVGGCFCSASFCDAGWGGTGIALS